MAHARTILLAALLLTGALAACRTEAVIDSEPRGARVTIGEESGITPFTISVPRTTFGGFEYRAEKEGYATGRGDLGLEISEDVAVAGAVFPPAWFLVLGRAPMLTTLRLEPAQRFPGEFVRTVPWEPDLPPLPRGMDQVIAPKPFLLEPTSGR